MLDDFASPDLKVVPLIVLLYPDMTMVKPYIFCSSALSTISIASTDDLRWTSNPGSIKTLRWKKREPGIWKKQTAGIHLLAEP